MGALPVSRPQGAPPRLRAVSFADGEATLEIDGVSALVRPEHRSIHPFVLHFLEEFRHLTSEVETAIGIEWREVETAIGIEYHPK